jgi:methylglyoxal synthase
VPAILSKRKNIGLVAHDHKKEDLVQWARFNRLLLAEHNLFATGTTGSLLDAELGLSVVKLKSGPLGGDQQLGAMISEGEIDFLVFFWDPLEPLPHEPDVKALLRIAVVWNIPVACNRATADFLISSPLMSGEYERALPDYGDYLRRHEPEPGVPTALTGIAVAPAVPLHPVQRPIPSEPPAAGEEATVTPA